MKRNSLFGLCMLGLIVTAVALALPAVAEEEQESAPPPPERAIDESERDHWAFSPLASVTLPKIDDNAWNANPIDRLVKSKLDEAGVVPLPPAGKTTLLRRVTIDLTGLPPTPQELDAFLQDDSPDAYEKVIDRLLASPSYGERWAAHWLDLARFAESDGFELDAVRPNAWRYRDWVIDALNDDLPYDEFLSMQLAGDELSEEPEAKVATGFLLCGPDMPDINLITERRHIVLNEMASTVGAVFLGLQVGCAQCHDHKYDPITQYDFYRLRAFFESVDMFRDHPIPTAAEAQARKEAEAARSDKDRADDKRHRELYELGLKRHRERNPDERPTDELVLAELDDAERAEFKKLKKKLASLPALPSLPEGRVMRDGQDRECHLFLRGDFRRAGPVVNCGYPRLLSTPEDDPAASVDRPRTALADWLTEPGHPLTSRVIVNRVWQWHFGRGLSPTPSDFGVMGTAPGNPALLDWLAEHFVRDKWSFKRLHRLLLTSRTYRAASAPFDREWSPAEAAAATAAYEVSSAADPHNDLWWRAGRQRLEAEEVRDGMLAVSDELSSRRGGPSIRPPLPPEVTGTLIKGQWVVNGDEEDHHRRSIYLFVRRNLRYPLFDVFDRPDTNATCPERLESTTAPQSLTLFNSEFSLDCARSLAGRLLQDGETAPRALIGEAYRRVFARNVTDAEAEQAAEFLKRQAQSLREEGRAAEELSRPATGDKSATGAAPRDPYADAALVDFCLALLNASDFLYVD